MENVVNFFKEHIIAILFFSPIVLFIFIIDIVQKHKLKCVSEKDIIFIRNKLEKMQSEINKFDSVEFVGGNRNAIGGLSLNRIDTIDKIVLTRNNISLFLLDKNRRTEDNARTVTYNWEHITLKYRIERVSSSGGSMIMNNYYYVLVKTNKHYKKYAILLSDTEEANLKAFIAFANILSSNIDFNRLSDDEMKSLLKNICK